MICSTRFVCLGIVRDRSGRRRSQNFLGELRVEISQLPRCFLKFTVVLLTRTRTGKAGLTRVSFLGRNTQRSTPGEPYGSFLLSHRKPQPRCPMVSGQACQVSRLSCTQGGRRGPRAPAWLLWCSGCLLLSVFPYRDARPPTLARAEGGRTPPTSVHGLYCTVPYTDRHT